VLGLVIGANGSPGGGFVVILGGIFVGGFLSYLSRHTVRIRR
jgi:hypothetical protein